MDLRLELDISRQPDDTTCGPTCLHSVYRYFSDPIALERVIDEVTSLKDGGTLGVILATHALRRGYRTTVYSYNLQVFDPTWETLDREELCRKLRAQRAAKNDPKLRFVTDAYLEYLELGGDIAFDELTPELVCHYLDAGVPLIAGLSSTYLYRSIRERVEDESEDDVHGYPAGHFVILCGHDLGSGDFLLADPLEDNPLSMRRRYRVGGARLQNAILLGVLTYDANLVVIEPEEEETGEERGVAS